MHEYYSTGRTDGRTDCVLLLLKLITHTHPFLPHIMLLLLLLLLLLLFLSFYLFNVAFRNLVISMNQMHTLSLW